MVERFNTLISIVKSYNPDEVEFVTNAYEFARECHKGQFRKSGEPYIIHPLEVTIILANMHADRDTLCAGLLHDVIEDCNVTKEEIAEKFNPKIAELVDGVTNFSKVEFQNRVDRKIENKKKLIMGILHDARVVIIKLADRKHNMLTMKYQNPEKQVEIAEETLTFYAPLARYIGAELLRRELEDLSFLYLDPKEYYRTKSKLDDYVAQRMKYLEAMSEKMNNALSNVDIRSLLRIRIKNLYTVYRKLKAGEFMENIHDLLAIKVLLKDIKDCYYALGIVHSLYVPYNGTFKDYICCPKSNMYSSLHTSVIGEGDTLTQVQIRTDEMEKFNMHGLTAYWDIYKGQAGDKMHEILRDKYKFEQSIKTINNIFTDSRFFVNNVQQNLLDENISVYGYDGHLIVLPEAATVIDFAYYYGQEFAEKMVGAFVNGNPVDVSTKLNHGDRVHILTSEEKMGPSPSWLSGTTLIETQNAIRKSLERK